MQTENTTAIIEEKEKEWMQAWIEKDEAKFNDILAEDFLLSSSRGVWMNKNQWINGAIGPFTCTDFAWKEIKVRVYGCPGECYYFTNSNSWPRGLEWGVYDNRRMGEKEW